MGWQWVARPKPRRDEVTELDRLPGDEGGSREGLHEMASMEWSPEGADTIEDSASRSLYL